MTGYTTVKTGVQLSATFDAWRNSEGQIEHSDEVWLGAPLCRHVRIDRLEPAERRALLSLAAITVEATEREANLP